MTKRPARGRDHRTGSGVESLEHGHLRPLGSMNRARKQAYDVSATTRGGRVLGKPFAEER